MLFEGGSGENSGGSVPGVGRPFKTSLAAVWAAALMIPSELPELGTISEA